MAHSDDGSRISRVDVLHHAISGADASLTSARRLDLAYIGFLP